MIITQRVASPSAFATASKGITSRNFCKILLTQQTSSYSTFTSPYSSPSNLCRQQQQHRRNPSPHHQQQSRTFTKSSRNQIKEFFPAPDTPKIQTTPPAWSHPIYTPDQINSVIIAHRNAKNWSDWVALGAVRFMRSCLDFATGYKHGVNKRTGEEFRMTERKYMIRNIFLESVAGVPGMVGGMLRHMRSLRKMKRDNGWIETLLEESYNERMHLLTFLKLAEPGWFMRIMVLGAQGVFFNGFFISYLISPRICHRFVGYLEEEAVLTYTREIQDIDAGKLPMWEKMSAPDIAKNYWNMPEGKQSMRDLLLYIRADEAKHREVNHTLGNLDQKSDPNPFVSTYKDGLGEGEGAKGEGKEVKMKEWPRKDMANSRATGWERDDVI